MQANLDEIRIEEVLDIYENCAKLEGYVDAAFKVHEDEKNDYVMNEIAADFLEQMRDDACVRKEQIRAHLLERLGSNDS